MSPVQCNRGLFSVFASDQQFGATNSWIHPTGIIGPDHGLNAHLIQNAFRDLGIGCGPECRNDNEV
jgi:hypothetical protein